MTSKMIREEKRRSLVTLLPLEVELSNNRPIVIDFMTESQISETYERIQECSEDGEGFGLDEFPEESDFRKDIVDGDCFALCCKETGEMLAGFILAISKYYRGSSGAVDPFVIVRKSERQKGIGYFCMKMVVDFSVMLGYQGIYIDTFCNNEAMKRILENTGGFSRVGYLPLGGRLKTGEVIGSYIYYKPLEDG